MPEPEIQDLRNRALAGDAEAQWQLGTCYLLGEGVPQSEQTAFRWFLRSAEAEFVDAMAEVGRAYRTGSGTSEDHAQALQWFERALLGGDTTVHSDLGEVLAFGEGVEHDLPRAIGLLEEGFAVHGDEQCAAVLADVFTELTPDPARALEWLARAAEGEHVAAMVQLGYRYRVGEGVPRSLAKMLHWYRQAAERGDAVALANLAACYANGEGVAVDLGEAHALRERAAALGHVPSERWLGFALLEGTGVARDPAEGLRRLEALAARDPETAHELGVCCVEGAGLDTDLPRGLAWLERAAAAEVGAALSYLGVLAWYGAHVPEDRALAVERYRAAADLGDPYGTANLGFALMEGEVVPRDVPRGIELVHSGAAAGNAHAALWLAERYGAGDGGFSADPSRARAVLEACLAVEEDADVLFRLAELCRDGVGGAADPRRALGLFERAQCAGRDARVELALLRRALRRGPSGGW